MRCEECKAEISLIFEELICSECGLVHGSVLDSQDMIFDSDGLARYSDMKVAGTANLGSKNWSKGRVNYVDNRPLQNGLFYCNMFSAEFSFSQAAKETLRGYYTKLKKEHIFTGRMRLEERAVALGYIVLKEFGYSYTLKEISKIFDISTKRISKLARLFARKLKLSYVFSNTNPSPLLEKFCLRLEKSREFLTNTILLYEYVNNISPQHPTSSFLSGIIYCVETTQLSKSSTQKNVAEVCDVGIFAVKQNYKLVLSILEIDSTFGLTINDIISGIR